MTGTRNNERKIVDVLDDSLLMLCLYSFLRIRSFLVVDLVNGGMQEPVQARFYFMENICIYNVT